MDLGDPERLLDRVERLVVASGLELADGVPVGLQIVGRPFDEATVLRVARAYEKARPWPLPELE